MNLTIKIIDAFGYVIYVPLPFLQSGEFITESCFTGR